MKIRAVFAVICLSYFSAPLTAQMQIGGGTCSSFSLGGVYSVTLTGCDVNASLVFAKVLDRIGTGTYSLQAHCSGTLSLTNGNTASLSLQSFNGGKNCIVTGQDGAFVYIQISNI